jgi:hypothetical protein
MDLRPPGQTGLRASINPLRGVPEGTALRGGA